MLHHALEGAVILFYFQHFIAPALDYCPACKPKAQGIAIRAVNSRREQWSADNNQLITYYERVSYLLRIHAYNKKECLVMRHRSLRYQRE